MLKSINRKVRDFLIALRHRGGIVSGKIVIEVTEAFISECCNKSVKNLCIGQSLAQNLFVRMGFFWRMSTRAKFSVPDKSRRITKFSVMYKTVNKIEKYHTPHQLVINADQTPLKYVPAGCSTLALNNSKNLPLARAPDQRAITTTLAQVLVGSFLPMQLIYKAKTNIIIISKNHIPRWI